MGLIQPYQKKKQPENYPYIGHCKVCKKIVYTLVPEPVIGPTNNEIWYTSSDGNVVNPYNTSDFGANIVSNTYEEDSRWVITFDGPVTSIGYWNFDGCYSLTSIVIPAGLTNIEMKAFYGCTSLTSITFKGTRAEWKENIKTGVNWKYKVPASYVQCSNAQATL